MIEILLGFFIFILGFIFGIMLPYIIYKYCSILKTENKEKIEKNMQKEQPQTNFNNYSTDIIEEWRTGKVTGDDSNE